MPSGRDSFRRNRVAPSVRIYFSTLDERLGSSCTALSSKLSVEFLLAGRVWGTPVVFVSVASKQLSLAVSLLFATLAEGFISVAAKEFTAADCWWIFKMGGWGIASVTVKRVRK
jgi:hypothetical protein